MIRIAGHSIAYYLGINLGAAAACSLELFKDKYSGPLADNKTIALGVKGTAGMIRIIISSGKGPHCGKTTNAHRSDCRFSSSAQHRVGISSLDDLETVADRVRAG